MKRALIYMAGVVALIVSGCNRQPAETAFPPSTTPVNLAAETARAAAENKLLLLEFGSSDSCPPCIELDRRVFSKPEFVGFAKSNLVFVRLDFPDRHPQPKDVAATNLLLAKQFEVWAYPTFIALDRDGKEFWRFPAKDDPNPTISEDFFTTKGFIQFVESAKLKMK